MSKSPRVPPHSIDAEQSVLGGLLLRNSAWDDIVGRLGPDDFYRQDHAALFTAIGGLIGKGQSCDFITLSESLRAEGGLEAAGGVSYLGSLVNDTPSAANVVAYAEIVRERSICRKLIEATNKIADAAYQPDDQSAAQLLETAEQTIFKIRNSHTRKDAEAKDLRELIVDVSRDLEAKARGERGVDSLSTGFVDLDRLTTGLHAGDLVVIGARPGVGKTTLAMNIAEHVAFREKKAVLVFSMEMPANQLTLRMLSSLARIDFGRLRSGDLTDRDWSQLSLAISEINEARLWIDDSGSLSPGDVRGRSRRLKRSHDIALIVIDYIQLMQVPNTRDNRTNEIAEVSRSLKALAKELSIPVIALSQLNRAVTHREGKRPMLSDLRESGGIEQDADLVILLHREDLNDHQSENKGMAEFIIAKQRNGPTDTIKTAFIGHYTRFENLARDA